MKLIIHRLWVDFKRLSKQVVEVSFISFVDLRESDGASVADLSLLTLALDSQGCPCTNFHKLIVFPVSENRVSCRKVSRPFTGMQDYIMIDTVFIVFLLVRIKEEIDAG